MKAIVTIPTGVEDFRAFEDAVRELYPGFDLCVLCGIGKTKPGTVTISGAFPSEDEDMELLEEHMEIDISALTQG